MRPLLLGLLAVCMLLSLLTGLFAGWFSINYRKSGQADRNDYLIASSAYGMAAVVVVLGLLTLAWLGVPGWTVAIGAVAVAICAVLALDSVARGLHTEQVRRNVTPWYDGGLIVLALPFTWPVVVLGLLTLVAWRP